MIVRELTEDDIQIVEELEFKSPFMISDMIDSPEFGWGLFDGKRLIGFCTLGYADCDESLQEFPEWSNDALLLSDVFIDEAYRGKGLGAYMIQRAIRLQGCSDNVFCIVIDDNLAPFYKKLGFVYKKDGVMVYTKDDFFPREHSPFHEHILKTEEARRCPHCGRSPFLRQLGWFDKPFVVACDCGFYQAAASRDKAVSLWNKTGHVTMNTALRRVDKQPKRKVIDTVALPGSTCGNCRFRRETYGKKPPSVCEECGHLNQRNTPYQAEIQVYKEEEDEA